MLSKYWRCLLMALTVSLISACGFHLQGHQGSTQLAQDLPPLHLIVKENDPRLRASVQAALARQGLSESILGPKLVVKRLTISTRDVSLTRRREAAERELIVKLSYQLQALEQSLTSSRVYIHNPNAVISSDQQRRQLEQDMIHELSQRMLQQCMTQLSQTATTSNE